MGSSQNNGWEVVIELVDKLWGIDDPKVKEVVGWAEEKLGEIGCSPEGEIGGRPAPREVRGGTRNKGKSSPDPRRTYGAGSIDFEGKCQVEKSIHPDSSPFNPGLEAGILRHALAAESALEATEVHEAMANAVELYAMMRQL